MEEQLATSTQELHHVQEELRASNALSSRLARELQELRQQHVNLVSERWERGQSLPVVCLLGWSGTGCVVCHWPAH